MSPEEQVAALKAELEALKQRHAHQCRLNTTLVEQNALLIRRNTALEKQLKNEPAPISMESNHRHEDGTGSPLHTPKA